jgi:hypothetical protein
MSLGKRQKKMSEKQNSIMNNSNEIEEKKMEEKRRKIKVAIAGVGNCASSLVQVYLIIQKIRWFWADA